MEMYISKTQSRCKRVGMILSIMNSTENQMWNIKRCMCREVGQKDNGYKCVRPFLARDRVKKPLAG